MNRSFYIIALILVTAILAAAAGNVFGQPPERRGGPPEWLRTVDVNRSGRIEPEEYRAAAEAFFVRLDRNGNGSLETGELPPPPRPVDGERPERRAETVPPFLFLERGAGELTREQFDERSGRRFAALDTNGDRALDFGEIRAARPDERPGFGPGTATAQFVGAEMRFGDKVVRNAPFSAATVREESKRLFDGSIVKVQSSGFIYRDGEGRLRHEQPLDRIGGFPVVGEDNQPKRLVQIVDPVAGESYALHGDRKSYSRIPYLKNSPLAPTDEPQNAKKESLGKQTIEGVTAEGTRTTFEIPAGRIGNDKPIFVVTERWYSPELQTVVLSKHTDPFIGEVVFRLVNIRLGEPAPELFKVPAGYELLEPKNKPERGGETMRRGRRPE